MKQAETGGHLICPALSLKKAGEGNRTPRKRAVPYSPYLAFMFKAAGDAG